MDIRIHRGSNEIGASCVEVSTATARILIDAGLPLDDSPASLPAAVEQTDAVFISHCHLDHAGLLSSLAADVPVYLGEVAKRLMQASRIFRKKSLLGCDFRPLKAWSPITIKGITVTPFLVDHSAPDAFAFLIEADGKRVFYSGDFRAHGRKSKLFHKLIRSPPADIDALLIEGTLLQRPNSAHPDEQSVEKSMLEAMRQEHGLVLLLCSSQNLDRMVSAYRACLQAGRTLVIDIYTAWVLEEIGKSFDTTPRMDWDKVRVLAHGSSASRHYGIVKDNPDFFGSFRLRIYKPENAIKPEVIAADPGAYVLKSSYVSRLLDQLKPASSTILYSMWEGYRQVEHNPRQARELEEAETGRGVRLVSIHTSGHAMMEDLQRFAGALRPGKLIPMHTEHKELFPQHFENVHILADEELLSL